MAKVTKSRRGETVDFDLLKIKEEISTAPKTDEVSKRERYVNRKLRRRPKPQVSTKMKEDMRKMQDRINSDDDVDSTDIQEEAVDIQDEVDTDVAKKSKKQRIVKK